MKETWKHIGLSLMLGILMPWLLLSVAVAVLSEPGEKMPTPILSTQTAVPTIASSRTVSVLIDDAVVQMDLSKYLTGVLLCEIPHDFHIEAKKAQAVVARTYALRTMYTKDKHPQNAVCTDPNCCQGYCAPEEYQASGGSTEAVSQAADAVMQTQGLVLVYAGELIDATYFSCSGGMTEDAVAVWGADIPYLQAVESPGEESAAHYADTVTFDKTDFCALLGVDTCSIDVCTWTEGGGVDRIVIGGEEFKGTRVRMLLGLRSTVFTITPIGERVIITTKGFGHRVGMSQYGAQAMANSGSDYAAILSHYYSDTELTTIKL